jgi:MoaD family protein
MMIRVKGYLTFRTLLGERQVEVARGLTLRALLAQLEQELGTLLLASGPEAEAGARPTRVPVLLNGRHCRHLREGLDTRLQDGDQVDLFPPIAGGAR